MPQTEAVLRGFREQRRILYAIGGTLIVLTLVIGWFGDKRSCERQVPVRKALIENREISRVAIPFWEARGEQVIADRLRDRVRADSGISQLDCTQVLPGT